MAADCSRISMQQLIHKLGENPQALAVRLFGHAEAPEVERRVVLLRGLVRLARQVHGLNPAAVPRELVFGSDITTKASRALPYNRPTIALRHDDFLHAPTEVAFFVGAHEMAHLLLGHGYKRNDRRGSQLEEMQADIWAGLLVGSTGLSTAAAAARYFESRKNEPSAHPNNVSARHPALTSRAFYLRRPGLIDAFTGRLELI